MNFITKNIPLWFKEPVLGFFKELQKGHPVIAFHHALCSFSDIYPCSEVTRQYIYSSSHKAVASYLHRKYAKLISEIKEYYSEGEREENFPIWIFWWQGEENAPEIVKICIENTREKAGKHPVYIVSERNFSSFVELPLDLINRVQSKEISVTHLSDILRMNLLAERGGLWLDATIYCTRNIEGSQFDKPVFSGRNPGGDYTNVSNWEWTTYAMFGWKKNWLYSLVRDVFQCYIQEHRYFVDYFLMDHIIRLVCTECDEVRREIENIGNNNEDVYYLNSYFECEYSTQFEERLRENNTWFYKLTWKKNYATETIEGNPTFYAKWLEMNRKKLVK